MFDHVAIAVSDKAKSEQFYRTVLSPLGIEPTHASLEMVEWDDFCIGGLDADHPNVSRGLHVAFCADDHAQVDAFWKAGVDAGYRDDGAPGPRPHYSPSYYGAFLLDPDGNSVEAVHNPQGGAARDGNIHHIRIRVRDPQAARDFYLAIAPYAQLELVHETPESAMLSGPGFKLSIVRDERPVTEHVHIAFPSDEDETVRGFHAAAIAAGYTDNGGPGERAMYHPGYYGAFVLDPDGNNIEVVHHNRH